jgi:ABC-type cobalamin/Fe3+-siderophores transport system ATPase subunit
MNLIKQLESGLTGINQARFQDLINHLLHVQGKTFISAPGSVVAKEKTSKGAPDSFFQDNGKYCFVECTTLERVGESKTFFNKLLKDVDHCFDESKTGIQAAEITEVVLAFTSTISAEEHKALSDRVHSFNASAELTVFDIQNLPFQIYGFPGLSEQYVGVTIVKGEIYNLPDFLEKTNRGLQPSLTNAFVGRKDELEQAEKILASSDILLLSGPAGVGKSKLAVAVLSTFAEKNDFIPIVIQSSAVPLWDDFVNLFQNGKDYIILFDDANKSAQNLSYLLDFIQKPKTSKLKLVITSRDYVKHLVERKLMDSRYQELSIGSFKDETIREIIMAALPALKYHPLVRDKIVELAKGNARMALMATASVQPDSQTNYLDSPLQLYEKYFEKLALEIELFQKPIGLQAIAIVSFFGVLERNNAKLEELLGKKFGIDWSELWSAILELHGHEVLDVYAEDTAKVSDQVLATYAFYKCFLDVKSSVLNYADWIEEFLSSHPSRLRSTLIDVNNTFNYEFVRDLVVPHLKKVSQGISADEQLYEFYKLFWFYLQMDAILFLRSWVKSLTDAPADPPPFLDFDFQANDFLRETEYFELITNFWAHHTEMLRPSLEIGFELVFKEPARLPEFLKFMVDNFGYQWEDVEHGFGRQQVLVDFLSQNFQGDKEKQIADGAYLQIARVLLGIHFTDFRSGRGHTFNITNFDLHYSPQLEALRKQLLDGVLDRFFVSEKLTWEILGQLKHPNGNFPEQLRVAEVPIYERLVSGFLSSENYRDCRFVRQLAEHLEHAGVTVPASWQSFIDAPVMTLAKILRNDFDYDEALGWEEQQKRKQAQLADHIHEMNWTEIREFILAMDHLLLQSSSKGDWTLEGASTEVYIAIGKKGKQELLLALQMFFSRDVVFSLQTRLFHWITKQGWLSPAELLATFVGRSFEGLTFWTMAFLQALPEEEVSLDYIQLLIGCFKQQKKKLDVHRFADFLKFENCFQHQYKPSTGLGELENHNIISYLTELMLEKKDEHIVFGYEFCSENAKHLEGQVDLLKRAFFKLKDLDRNFDHNGKQLEAVIRLDNEFIIEYLERKAVNDSYLNFRFERFKLDCLWELQDYHSIITRCLDIIIAKSPVWSNSSHGSSTLFVRNPNTQQAKAKAMEVIESYVDRYFAERQKMMMVGNILLSRYPEEFVPVMRRLLLLNKDLEILRSIYFSVSISAISGSFIPKLKAEQQLVKDLKQMVMSLPGVLDYAEHIKYLDEYIEYMKRSIDQEFRRDFEDSLE